jgi:hypothetical protein
VTKSHFRIFIGGWAEGWAVKIQRGLNYELFRNFHTVHRNMYVLYIMIFLCLTDRKPFIMFIIYFVMFVTQCFKVLITSIGQSAKAR